MRLRVSTATCLLLGLSASAITFAQNRGPVTYAALDANSDGEVSLEEFTENFNPPARNNGRTPQPDRVFGRWDANQDGVLTLEEFNNRPRRQQGQRQNQ